MASCWGDPFNRGPILGFLDGQTRPAKFQINNEAWAVRYMKDPRNVLPASAGKSWDQHKNEEEIEVMSGPAMASKFLIDAHYPALEYDPLDKFWEEDNYLEIAATARVTDTWIMNFDRRKKGNIVLTGSSEHPQVWFLDSDQGFLAKEKSPPHGRRFHWFEEGFNPKCSDDPEVLSGFDGQGGVKCGSIERQEHFQNAINKMITKKQEYPFIKMSETSERAGVSGISDVLLYGGPDSNSLL